MSEKSDHLPWPTIGKTVTHFGARVEQSDLKWSGILVRAPEGRDVTSIFPGTVVFADWLKGFGQLVIIDHGQGYMSLYGRNRNLYKQLGESVEAGERIAQVGQSGGFSESGLYFEIRHNGRPLDPERWLRRQAS